MGGCCSAQGTAKGSPSVPGAPAAREKAKATGTHPVETKAPVKAEGKKTPVPAVPAAQPGKTPEPAAAAPQPTEAKKPAEVYGDKKKEEEKPRAAPAETPKKSTPPTPPAATAASAFHDKPPASPSDNTHHEPSNTSPNLRFTAKPEEREKSTEKAESSEVIPPPLKAEEESNRHAGNSPTSTLITKAFPSLGELKATPPPPPSLEPLTEKKVVEFSLPSPPAMTKASPVNLTPERAQPLRFTPLKNNNSEEQDEAVCTRGPSTARVEEVPPTPARESDVATGKALPADDARVLQRVPPPPPPPMLSASSTQEEVLKEEPQKESEDGAKEAKKPAAAAESNMLAEIVRRQQEEKQHYPTALTTDAADDAPLEVNMEEDKNSAVAAGVVAAAGLTTNTAVTATTLASMRPLAEPGTVLAFPAANDHGDGSAAEEDTNATARHSGLVYKILLRNEWEELNATGVFSGNARDRAVGCIKFSTADQAFEAAAVFAHDRTPRVVICCTLDALAKPDEVHSNSNIGGEKGATLRWEPAPLIGQRTPRLYRDLHRKGDILWFKECADGSEVLEQLRKEMADADSSSEGSSNDPAEGQAAAGDNEEEPEKMVFDGYEDDIVNKPISFTDTSEIERQLVEKNTDEDDNNNNFKEREEEGATSRMSPPTENHTSVDKPIKVHPGEDEKEISEHENDDVYNDDDNGDKPQPVVKDVVWDVTLAPPAGEPLETQPPAPHAVAAMMQAPEVAGPVSPREERVGGASGGLAPPRRVPPPLPPPPAELAEDHNTEGEKDGFATPPPSRAALPTILSPPPV